MKRFLTIALQLSLLFCLTTAYAAEPFRFALLTDIHINRQAPRQSEDLTEAVDQINATQDIDFVLVDGDIADHGDTDGLRLAKQLLDRLQKPWWIVMGNHDTKWTESGGEDFKHIFGYERFRMEHKGYLFLGFNSGPLLRMSLGHVAPEDIAWIKQELETNGKGGKRVFLVTHYPMLPEDTDNGYDLIDAVKDYPIAAFLNGHYHRNKLLNYDGIPGIVNITDQRGSEAHGQYNVYTITDDSIIVATQPVGGVPRRWAALPMGGWTFKESMARPDFSVNERYPQLKEVWRTAIGSAIYSPAVVTPQGVVVGDRMGRLTCLDLHTGQQRWVFSAVGPILGTPAAWKGTIVAGSNDGGIYGVDAKSGRQRWRIATGRPQMGAVAIYKGMAFIGGGDGTMRAIDVKTGRVVWENRCAKGYIETLPLVTDGMIIFGAWDNTLYALDEKSGALRWTWRVPREGFMFSPAAVWPVSAHGKVFIVDPDRALTAIDLKTGRTLYRTKQSRVRESIGLSEDGKRLYAKTMQDSIVCYSTLTDQPCQLWATDAHFGYEHATTMLPEKDGVVYSSTKNGLIIELVGKTGQLLGTHKVGNTLINTVTPIGHRQAIFTNEDGIVGLLRNIIR